MSNVVYKENPEESSKVELTDPFDLDNIPSNLSGKFKAHEGKFNWQQIKFMVYGESGSGKTVFASTWPSCAFIDLDNGMSSIKRKVFQFKIETWEDLLEAIDYLKHSKHPFKTVVMDSVNELQALSLRHIVSSYSVRRPYDSMPSQSDYGKMIDDCDLMVREIRSIPTNVVFIAQVAARVYETDPVQPQFTGKATARNISRMMDEIGFLEKRESEGKKKRVMVFDAVNFVTKDRSDVLPQSIEDPTYEALSRYWNPQT